MRYTRVYKYLKIRRKKNNKPEKQNSRAKTYTLGRPRENQGRRYGGGEGGGQGEKSASVGHGRLNATGCDNTQKMSCGG